ncbi:MAG TPA: PIG-L deacetylase family protein [Bryobacteraceae bacterium]|nr:PIG-L deacetylase family protein [Bryobacteraceae bacterium]
MPIEERLESRRVLVVAAHPDDETIGCGGLLGRLRDPLILHVTDGAPRNLADAHRAGFELREDYAQARRMELRNALELAGIREEQTRSFDIPDQEASLDLTVLATRVADVLRQVRPAAILTHPYEGGHPDHDATAFAVHAACALVPAAPDIYEFTSYHAAFHSRQAGELEMGQFLIDSEPGEAVQLTDLERERKRRMIECFATQLEMLRRFPLDIERFRPAPVYTFIEPPHPGKLFYENFDWGMTGERWRRLAAEALEELVVAGT